MNRFPTLMTLIIVALLQYSVTVFAGPLDDYYLQQFGETGNTQLQKAILSVSPEAEESARCGMPLNKNLRRDWNLLEQSTQKVLAKQLALPTLSGPEQFVVSSGGHFKVHYTDVAPDAPDVSQISTWPGLSNITSTADWARQVAEIFEQIYGTYASNNYNYRLVPLPLNNPSGSYDIYLQELSGRRLYGFTTQPTLADGVSVDPNYIVRQPFPNSFSSYIVIDNDFTEALYTGASGGPFSPLQSLQITAAHEYHHAVQFGYNFFFDVWYAEATSTWIEDELFDDVNQLYSYITNWFTQSKLSLDTPASITTGGGYGRWIFNRFLAEKHGTDMIRTAWERLALFDSPGGGADIPMAPVLDTVLSSTFGSTLSNDFFGFSKRVYQRDWSSHQADIVPIHPYSPVASYAVSSLPVSAGTFPAPSVTLPHYSFAYYLFTPAAGAPNDLPIKITGTSGIKATVFRKNGSTIVEFPFAQVNGQTITVPGFSASTEVVLLIANTTDVDNHSANFSTNGTGVSVTEPSGGSVYPPLVLAAPAASNSSGSSSGGCFIATAAYGSYLHPQVQLLRNFRDEYLLTNAPGRAFVALYYRNSPPLADFIAHHPVLRGAARLALTPLVVAVAHPLISAVSLLLLFGAMTMPLLRRIKAARSNPHPYGIRTT